jgi:hypothetical protein
VLENYYARQPASYPEVAGQNLAGSLALRSLCKVIESLEPAAGRMDQSTQAV